MMRRKWVRDFTTINLRAVKDMKRLPKMLWLISFYLGLIPLLTLIAAFLSGFIIVGRDYSSEATVGIITLHGFPIWFIATAPGISIMQSWHPERFGINIAIWFLVLLAIGIATHIIIRKKKHRV